MTKIILKNAGICVNPILEDIEAAVSSGTEFPVGTAVMGFLFTPNTVNTPCTAYVEWSNNGTTWTPLNSRTMDNIGQYTLAIPVYPPFLPLNTLYRVRIVNNACGERISNALLLNP